MTFKVTVARVDSIGPHPEQAPNSVVSAAGLSIVTMRDELGGFRFTEGELVVIVPENAVIPEALLRATGFWNEEKGKGYLAGSKGNRVKPRIVGGILSEALIWHTSQYEGAPEGTVLLPDSINFASEGDDVAGVLGITEYIPE